MHGTLPRIRPTADRVCSIIQRYRRSDPWMDIFLFRSMDFFRFLFVRLDDSIDQAAELKYVNKSKAVRSHSLGLI